MEDFQKIIINLINSRIKNPADLNFFKRKISKKYGISCPSNIELLKEYHKLVKNKTLLHQGYGGQGIKAKIESLLRTRPVRSLSGIVNISVLTKPYSCPGKCLYCPSEKGIPKSYLSGEPAVERAKKLNYDPYWQTKKRIEMLEAEGHPTDKIELRIVGGTWSYYPKKYQEWFVKRCFLAANGKKYTYDDSLLLAQKLNEKTKHRIVGLSVETRPDFINKKEIKQLRRLGATMVELGIQSIYDDVLKLNKRGHGTKEIIEGTKLLKDAGFKVLYQMMPNLFGSNLKRDERMFEELFQNECFQPDLLKIYPCALLKEASLYKIWKKKKYRPYNEKQLLKLVKSIKEKIPYYVRIQRIARDIPSQKIIEGGAKISNLRQILKEKMRMTETSPDIPSHNNRRRSAKENWQCKCIRCREVKKEYNPKEKIYLFRQNYQASRGKEIFLTFENENRTKLYSLLRLRIPPIQQLAENCSRLISPELKDTAIIREIHTYGQLVSINKTKIAPQHRGFGKKLIEEAEKITKKEFKLNKIAAIAGIGARNYFRKSGYRLKETYMIKKL